MAAAESEDEFRAAKSRLLADDSSLRTHPWRNLALGEAPVMASVASPSRHRIPSGRTDVGKLCRAIEQNPNQQVTVSVLRDALGWPREKFDRVLAKALADPNVLAPRSFPAVDR